jgi:hypothetical protein
MFSVSLEGVHDVAVGELDMCVGDFWSTYSRRMLLAETGSFTAAIAFDEFYLYTVEESDDNIVTAIFRFFKPATPRLWLAILGVLACVAIAVYITEGDPCNPGEVAHHGTKRTKHFKVDPIRIQSAAEPVG